jgi:hypothetical protein
MSENWIVHKQVYCYKTFQIIQLTTASKIWDKEIVS